MTERAPMVTVLMPVYNDAQRVRAAVDSVLCQTFTDFELLVIDDGSTDGTAAVLRQITDPRLHVLHNESNLGLPGTLNRGLAEARGIYVARMDSDDLCLPPRLATQVAFLEARPEVAACGSWVETFGAGDAEVWEYPEKPEEVRAGLLFRPTIAHPAAMLRKTAFAAAGVQYDPEFRSSEDHDFWARASERLILANVPQVLLRYRLAPPALAKTEIKEAYADRVRKRLLSRLGIQTSTEALALHGLTARCEVRLDVDFLIEADAWLRRLDQANQTSAVYPPAVLRRLLAHRFWRLCSQSALLGPAAYNAFLRSVWRKDAGVSSASLLRFCWQCRRVNKLKKIKGGGGKNDGPLIDG